MRSADADLVAKAVIADLIEAGALSGNIDPLELELLLQTLAKNLGAPDAADVGAAMRIAAE